MDPQIRALQSSPATSLVVDAIPLVNSSDTILCDTSTGVPANWRQTVFDSLHCLSHPGIRATQRLITARYVWPGINSDVRRWTRSCIQCQRTKVQRHTVAPLSPFHTPDARFDVVHIDLVGPLPPSRGFTYLLTCVDRSPPHIRNHNRSCCSSLHQWLDRSLWCTLYNCHRSWSPV